VHGDAGIIESDMYIAKRLLGAVRKGIHISMIGDIGYERRDLRSRIGEPLPHRLQGFRPDVRHHDVHADCCELGRSRSADA
jgi:hypothetical protein